MSLHRLLAWIRTTRRDSTQLGAEEGLMISARLRDLSAGTNFQPAETAPTTEENERAQKNRDKSGT
jgi:hypothetical protein